MYGVLNEMQYSFAGLYEVFFVTEGDRTSIWLLKMCGGLIETRYSYAGLYRIFVTERSGEHTLLSQIKMYGILDETRYIDCLSSIGYFLTLRELETIPQ